MSKELNPYQARILFEWKNEEVIVEFTNPNRPNIHGKIVEVDVWHDKIMLDTPDGEIWIHGGVRCIRKIKPEKLGNVPESIPSTLRKEYSSKING